LIEQLVYYLQDENNHNMLSDRLEDKSGLDTLFKEKQLLDFTNPKSQKVKILNLRLKFLSKEEIFLLCVLFAHDGDSCTVTEVLSCCNESDKVKVDSPANILSDQVIDLKFLSVSGTHQLLDNLVHKRFLQITNVYAVDNGDSKKEHDKDDGSRTNLLSTVPNFKMLPDAVKSTILMERKYKIKNNAIDDCELFCVHNIALIQTINIRIANKLESGKARNAEIANQYV